MSIEVKVLYGLTLDRMGLPVRNGWMDREQRVYIYFTQEDAMMLMNCGKDKVTKLFREVGLDGIGLIERKQYAHPHLRQKLHPAPEPGQMPPNLEPSSLRKYSLATP